MSHEKQNKGQRCGGFVEITDQNALFHDSILNKIHVIASEELDAFIFKIISPFCNQVIESMEIKKKDLEDLIIKYKSVKPLADGRCVCCGKEPTNETAQYCECCGQRLREDPNT